MVYKKYIKRNGKIYGPYTYQSRRVNGKVVSDYLGRKKISFNKNLTYIFIGVFCLMFLSYFGYYAVNQRGIHGQAILESQTTLTDAGFVDGVLKLSLQQGELIPVDSKIILEDSLGNEQEFILQDLIDRNASEGDFYVKGKYFYNEGQGYGIIGEKKFFPLVDFTMKIYSSGEKQSVEKETTETKQTQESTETSEETEEQQTSEESETSTEHTEEPQETSENKTINQEETSSEEEQQETSESSESGQETETEETEQTQESTETSEETEEQQTSEEKSTEEQQETETKQTETTTEATEESDTEETSTESETSSESQESSTQSSESSESSSETSQESSSPESSSESSSSESSESSSSSESPESAPITGNFVFQFIGGFFNFFQKLTPTGKVVETQTQNQTLDEKIITAQVSADKPFVYELKPGETAEIINFSEEVELKIKEGNAIVTTNYYETEEGFGSDYLGEESQELEINFSELDLNLEEGDLQIKLVYDNEEILSLQTELITGETTKAKNQTILEITNQTISNQTLNQTSKELFLTDAEKQLLLENFGNDSATTTKAEEFNNRLIIKHKLGDYWVEYSYDYNGVITDSLLNHIEKDKIKWLKDLVVQLEINKNAKTEKKSEENPELEGLFGNYSF